jgi:hypothetical protein
MAKGVACIKAIFGDMIARKYDIYQSIIVLYNEIIHL